MARIFSFFGNKSLVKVFRRSIYEEADIPTCFPYSSHDDTLGKMVPAIYAVRNASAHGQKVPTRTSRMLQEVQKKQTPVISHRRFSLCAEHV